MWLYMFIVNMLIPIVMIVFGNKFYKSAPKEINWAFGYRTSRSMQNIDTWQFAHRYIGNIWRKLGWVLLVISAAAMLLVRGCDINTVSTFGGVLCVLQIVPMVVPMFFTEKALKQTFDEYGNRK